MKDLFKLIGALTSKPYAFEARPWELENIDSIDYHDAAGTNVKVSIRGSEILRILPRINDRINEEWISDKTRFSYDGLKQQRLFTPLLKVMGKFKRISWEEAFEVIRTKFYQKHHFEGICGNSVDSETLILFKDLLNKIGNSSVETRNSAVNLTSDLRTNYLMNTAYENIDKADVCLLIGTNPRLESPVFNLKLRKNVISKGLKVAILGYSSNLTYPVKILKNNSKNILNLLEGRGEFCKDLVNAKFPLVYFGISILQKLNLESAITNILQPLLIRQDWNGLNIIQQFSTNISGLDLNSINLKNYKDFKYKNKILYILNCDEIDLNKENENFVIYQGHTGDILASQADLILPGSTLLEKNSTLINNEGLNQLLNFCVKPPEQARNDWKILQALGNYLNLDMRYFKLENIRKKMRTISPSHNFNINSLKISKIKNRIESVNNSYLLSYTTNFYMTDSISRNSHTLALVSNRFNRASYNFIEEKINDNI